MPTVMDDETDPYEMAATKIQSAHRGKKARTSTVPRQRRLRTNVDASLVREVDAKEEAKAIVEAEQMVRSHEWAHAEVQRFSMSTGGQTWLCGDEMLENAAVQSQSRVFVRPKSNTAADMIRFRGLTKCIMQAKYEPSANCATVEIGEVARVLEVRKQYNQEEVAAELEAERQAEIAAKKKAAKEAMSNKQKKQKKKKQSPSEPEPEPEPEPELILESPPGFPPVNLRLRVKVSGSVGWVNTLTDEGEKALELVKEQPRAASDVLCVAIKPFSCVQPKGIDSSRAMVSPLVQAFSLPGSWNAAFAEDSGVIVRVPLCVDRRHRFVARTMEIHWQPVPANPYNPGWELLRPLKVVSTGDMVVIADDDADPFSRAASKIQANFRGRKARAAGLASLAAASMESAAKEAAAAKIQAVQRGKIGRRKAEAELKKARKAAEKHEEAAALHEAHNFSLSLPAGKARTFADDGATEEKAEAAAVTKVHDQTGMEDGPPSALMPLVCSGVYCRMPRPGNVVVTVSAIRSGTPPTAAAAHHSNMSGGVRNASSGASMLGNTSSLFHDHDSGGPPKFTLGEPRMLSIQLLPFRPPTVDSAEAQFAGGHLGHCVGEVQLVRGCWYRLELDSFVRTLVQRSGEWGGRCRPSDLRVCLTSSNKLAPYGTGAHSNAGSKSEIRRWIGQPSVKFELSAVVQTGAEEGEEGAREQVEEGGLEPGTAARLVGKQTAVRVWARPVNSDGTKYRKLHTDTRTAGADASRSGNTSAIGGTSNLSVGAGLELVYENLEALSVDELKRLLTSLAASNAHIHYIQADPPAPAPAPAKSKSKKKGGGAGRRSPPPQPLPKAEVKNAARKKKAHMRAASDLEKRLFAERVSLMTDKAALIQLCRSEGVPESSKRGRSKKGPHEGSSSSSAAAAGNETGGDLDDDDGEDAVPTSQCTHVPFALAGAAASAIALAAAGTSSHLDRTAGSELSLFGIDDSAADGYYSPPATPPDRRGAMLKWASPSRPGARLSTTRGGLLEPQPPQEMLGDAEISAITSAHQGAARGEGVEEVYMLPPDDGDVVQEEEEDPDARLQHGGTFRDEELSLHKRRTSEDSTRSCRSSSAQQDNGSQLGSRGCCGRRRRKQAEQEYEVRQVSPWLIGSQAKWDGGGGSNASSPDGQTGREAQAEEAPGDVHV